LAFSELFQLVMMNFNKNKIQKNFLGSITIIVG